MLATVVPTAEPPETVTSAEIARTLNVSERHIRRLYEAGQFPRPIRLGKRLRVWLRKSVNQWLATEAAKAQQPEGSARA
jgi:predicted DNA-binding transcriptional regulator AlpA